MRTLSQLATLTEHKISTWSETQNATGSAIETMSEVIDRGTHDEFAISKIGSHALDRNPIQRLENCVRQQQVRAETECRLSNLTSSSTELSEHPHFRAGDTRAPGAS